MAPHFQPTAIIVTVSSPWAFAEESNAPLFVAKTDTNSESCPTWHPGKKWSAFVRPSVGLPYVSG